MVKMPLIPLPLALPPLLVFIVIELSGIADVPTLLYLSIVFFLPYIVRSQVIRLLEKGKPPLVVKFAIFLGGKFEEGKDT